MTAIPGSGVGDGARRLLPLAPVTVMVGLIGAPGSALAISGETADTIVLFGIESCGATGVDALSVCVETEDGEPGDCDLFEIDADDTLSTLLCPGRSVLLEPEFFPDSGPIEEFVKIRGSSFGYIRAFLRGEGEPVNTVTHTLGSTVRTVELEPGAGTIQSCPNDGGAQIELFAGATGAEFCARVADALPVSGGATPDIRFIVGYDYENGGSNFGSSNFLTVWACSGFDAMCVDGSPAPDGAIAVSDEIWLSTGLTNSWNRIRR